MRPSLLDAFFALRFSWSVSAFSVLTADFDAQTGFLYGNASPIVSRIVFARLRARIPPVDRQRHFTKLRQYDGEKTGHLRCVAQKPPPANGAAFFRWKDLRVADFSRAQLPSLRRRTLCGETIFVVPANVWSNNTFGLLTPFVSRRRRELRKKGSDQ